jgi:hypothetical protein
MPATGTGTATAPTDSTPIDGSSEECPCPKCGRKKHDTTYRRTMAERRKALLRDAADPNSELSGTARESIRRSNGENVPTGYEVSHEEPLYTVDKKDRCELDVADNMKTQKKSTHRARHKHCGDQYHQFPR